MFLIVNWLKGTKWYFSVQKRNLALGLGKIALRSNQTRQDRKCETQSSLVIPKCHSFLFFSRVKLAGTMNFMFPPSFKFLSLFPPIATPSTFSQKFNNLPNSFNPPLKTLNNSTWLTLHTFIYLHNNLNTTEDPALKFW